MPPKPEIGDLFYTLNKTQIHIFLEDKNGRYYFYGPLNDINDKSSLWALTDKKWVDNNFNEGSWTVIKCH